MTLKLAKKELDDKQEVISFDEIQKQAEENGSATFYIDKDNSLKDIQKLKAALEKNSNSVYLNEIRYGLDNDSFLYELHIISQ